MDERAFYTEKPEAKRATYGCPKCRQSAEFQVRWLLRAKKRNSPPRANPKRHGGGYGGPLFQELACFRK